MGACRDRQAEEAAEIVRVLGDGLLVWNALEASHVIFCWDDAHSVSQRSLPLN